MINWEAKDIITIVLIIVLGTLWYAGYNSVIQTIMLTVVSSYYGYQVWKNKKGGSGESKNY